MLPNWIQMIIVGGFVLIGLTYLNPSPTKLKEGNNLLFSWPDKLSMLVVLVWSVALLMAPVVSVVAELRSASIVVGAIVLLLCWYLITKPPIRNLSRTETALVIGLPTFVVIGIFVGLPSSMRSLATVVTIASLLSAFVAFTADADESSTRIYHHDNFLRVIHIARWSLRLMSLYGVYHATTVVTGWIDSAIHILIIIDTILVALAVTLIVLGMRRWKGVSYGKGR
jgi:hypothetical protein